MADRRDFYYRQKVTEAELDDAFAELENADRAITSDLGFIGIAVGMAVTQQASPNLTVQVTGPGVVYDQTGQRIAIPSTQTVNCAVDEGALTTAVVTPGNSKILSIFAEFDRTLSDPRVDGNSATVFFVRTESFQFNVAASAEAVTPTAPPLRSDQILLADVALIYGQTQILTADISATRRQWMFKTSSGTSVEVGTAEEAIQALATAIGTTTTGLSDHLADTTGAHAASAISNTPAGGISASDVQSALNELDTEKFAKAGGTITGNLEVLGTSTFGDEMFASDIETGGRLLFTNASAHITFDVDGKIQFDGPTGPAVGANPGINTLHARNIAKAWATVTTDGSSGVLLNDAYGIASAVITGTDVRVTFSNAFADTAYAVLPSDGGTTTKVRYLNKTTTTVDFQLYDVPGGSAISYATNALSFSFVIFGLQL